MQAQAEQTSITRKPAKHRRCELTAASVADLLRLDEAGCLYWLANQRGRVKAGTRAGCAITRRGKAAGRVITIEGVRYREHHVITLLTTGAWPEGKRSRRKVKAAKVTVPIGAISAVMTTPATRDPVPAPIVVPRQLPELSRAAIAAAKPQHRGWLAGLGLNLARRA